MHERRRYLSHLTRRSVGASSSRHLYRQCRLDLVFRLGRFDEGHIVMQLENTAD
jgi:hypothetical protein